jgi:hypothetical protein
MTRNSHPQKRKAKKKKKLEEAGHIYLEHLWNVVETAFL